MRRPAAPRLLVHVDERRRDPSVMLALRHLLEAAGCRVVLSSRWTTARYVRRIPFDAVIVPSLLHVPYDDLPWLTRRSKIYMLPTEGNLFEEWPLLVKYGGGATQERWPRQIQATARFFLWGDYSRRILQATGRFHDEQLVVAGAPRMDLFLLERRQLDDASAVGLISDFVQTNSYHQRNIFHAVNAGRVLREFSQGDQHNIEDRYWIEAAWVRTWVELFDACRARGERLQVRIHPREHLDSYRYLERHYGDVLHFHGQAEPFEIWLDRVGMLLGFNSTTFFEAVAAGKAVANLEGLMGSRLADHLDGSPMNQYPILEYIERPQSLEALFAFITRVRAGAWSAAEAYGPACRALLRDVCHFPRETATLATVVETIVHDLDGTGRWGGLSDRLLEALWRVEAKARETFAFYVHRTPQTSVRYPMKLRRFEAEHREAISRYLRAAAAFPARPKTSSDDPSWRRDDHVRIHGVPVGDR